MPACGRFGTTVACEIGFLFVRRKTRGFLRIDAEGDDLELFARRPLDFLERIDEPIQRERAEIRALIINELNQDGAAAPEKALERNDFAGLIPKTQVFELDRLTGVIRDSDALHGIGSLRGKSA